MKKQLLCVLLLLADHFLIAQTTIVQWDFNSNMSPSLGQTSATIGLVGGIDSTHYGGVSFDTGNPNNALGTSNYPAQGSGAKTAGIQINLNTVGYQSIHLKFYSQHSGAAANKVIVQHLVNNVPFDDTFYVKTAAGSYNTNQYDFDLSAHTVLNNSNSVSLRLVTDFAAGNAYQGITTGYGRGGTIRYDLLTITGNSIGCGTPATKQASGLRLLKTDNSSAQLTLNRGDGGGCLVLCSTNGIPNTALVTGTNYAANSTYGSSGTAIGNAFAVYNTQVSNPSTQYFNINGLTAGTKYYIAAYEYSSTGYCYFTPGMVDSFYCNSTILYPGDIQFVGFDNAVATGGVDAYAITNLKSINRGTSFQIVNSRYEAGAAANVRTQRWYGGNDNIYNDLEIINILYTAATPLSAGSVMSFDFDGSSNINNIRVGTTTSNAFIITSNATNSLLNSANNPDPEQLFLTQGRFTSFGTRLVDLYSLFEGHVLHGVSSGKDWISFSQTCGTSSDRESRLPSDIKCLNVSFPATNDFGYYRSTALHSGSQGPILGQLANRTNWTYGNGTAGNDISTIYSVPFTGLSSPTTISWTGGANTNWFNCSNWENLYVPDSTANTLVTVTSNAPAINVSNALAAEYSNLASVRNLSIANIVALNGNTADKLIVYDSLVIGSNGSLITSGATDTVIVRGSIQSQNVAGGGIALNINGWLSLNGNRQLLPITVSLASPTPVGVAALSLNNPPGINLNNGGFVSLQKLELLNGILSPGTNGFHYIDANCAISSPISYYGSAEPNIGWEKSYIDSKVFISTGSGSSAISYTAPLGSKQKGTFSPMIIRPQTGGAVYEAGYIGMSHPNVSPADVNDPPIKKVSNQEYWTLVSYPNNAAANISLYYTPGSFVAGPQGTDPQALADLKIVQYWDTSANRSPKWKFPTVPVSYNTRGTVQYGKISMNPGLYATSLRESDKNFTLGSAMGINTLPLQIIAWQAQLQTTHTRLSWQVQQEMGTAFYTIEKSLDGKSFQPIRTVYAAGLPAYACYDEAPADGWNYYRLKITDVSGKVSYTTIEKVWLKHTATFAAFPNPASEKVFISLPSAAKATINLYAPDGRKCLEQATASSFTQLNVKGLSAGWYLLEYWDGKNRLTQKLLIK